MRVSKEKLDEFQQERQKKIVVAASEMFLQYGIDYFSMQKISKVVDIPIASIKRYFVSTSDLVTQSVTYLIENFFNTIEEQYAALHGDSFTAYQEVEFFIDSFIYAYEHHRSFIRFTLDYNIYVKSHLPPAESLQRYNDAMARFHHMFSKGFAKGQKDNTIVGGLLDEQIFFTCFNVMLAVVQKFSYGNMPQSQKNDDLAEILLLKKMMLQYVGGGSKNDKE